MKLGVFTDSHYSSKDLTAGDRFNSQSLRKIQEALEVFKKEKCELVICLGDLIDTESDHQQEIINLTQIADAVRESGLPFTAVMGNHDGFEFTREEYYKILGEDCRPRFRSDGKTSLIFIDACYFDDGEHYGPGGRNEWKETFFPHVDELKKQLDSSQGDVYIFMHQNLDPTLHPAYILTNAVEIRELLEKSGKVRGVFQGHYHKGNTLDLNGIRYTSFPAMCCKEGAYFILDL